jgi:hypothetical protein
MREVLDVFCFFICLALFVAGITAIALAADVPAPQSIVIVACKVDDLTGQPGRQDPNLAAKGWRDLELHINENQEYECKREVLHLEDGAIFGPNAPEDLLTLTPDFADAMQCARVGMMQATEWNTRNPGWGVVAVGCPTRIVNEDGETVGWQEPGCPQKMPGTENRMKCVFDENAI